jgi:hypothetical protein
MCEVLIWAVSCFPGLILLDTLGLKVATSLIDVGEMHLWLRLRCPMNEAWLLGGVRSRNVVKLLFLIP